MIFQKRVRLFTFLCLFHWGSTVAFSALLGLPKIVHLSENCPEVQMSNGAVECDNQGIIYIGNNLGVFIYDGNKWLKIYSTTSNGEVRSLKVHQNRIYVGMNDDFGYLEKTNSGKYIYHSLLPLLNPEDRNFRYVWKINALGSEVIFQTFEYLFLFKNETIKIIKPETLFHNLFVINNQIIVKQFERGLYELSHNSLKPIPEGNQFANKDIFGIEPIDARRTLIFTARNGIYLWEDNVIKPWNAVDNVFFVNNPISRTIVTSDKKFVVGTANNGIAVVDEFGKIILHANKTKGLKSNSILDIRKDVAGNILVATENGVEYIELNSPFQFLDERIGLDAKVFDLKIFDGKMYVATKQGVFISNALNGSNLPLSFTPITNIIEQIWKLEIIDNQLYALTHTGIFLIKDEKLSHLHSDYSEGMWKFLELNKNPNYIIQGAYNGINLYKKGVEKIEFVTKIKGFTNNSRIVEIDANDNIWVAQGKNGVFRVELNATMTEAKVTNFLQPKDSTIYDTSGLLVMDKKLAAVVNGLIYIFDEKTESFALAEILNKTLSPFFPISAMKVTKKDEYFFVGGDFMSKKIGLINIQGSEITITPFPNEKIRGKLISSFESCIPIAQNQYALNLSDGIVLYNNQSSNNYIASNSTIISEIVVDSNDSITTHLTIHSPNAGTEESIVEIPYIHNAITFNYFSTAYNQNSTYSTYLEGADKGWNNWQTDKRKEYTNIPEGKYTFWVKSRNTVNDVSEVTYFKFRILAPWYNTYYAYIIYFILAIALIIGSLKAQQIFLQKKARKTRYKEILNHRLEQRRAQQERAQAEKEVIELKNDKLKMDLANKSQEVTSSAIHVMYLNETLNDIQTKLNPILNDPDSKNKSKLKSVLEQINYKINKTDDWDKFEMHFNQIHQGFLQRLKADFPDLSSRELRLCAYLRTNISSKEIAPFLGINYRSVEVLRYRTRKKLKLDANQSLTEFIIGY